MNKSKMLALAATTAVLAACTTEPTLTERNYGVSVRQMIEAQTYDPSTIQNPSTETVDSSDGQRAGNVLEGYRRGVTAPEAAGQGVDMSIDE
jgi:type IV pilus biogenesis protein CpaD/CtpE